MATETQTRRKTEGLTASDWAAGAVGGFIGSILFGLIMQFVIPVPLLEMAIPAMYGVAGPALLAGWVFHLFHGVVLGLVYVALVQLKPLREPARHIGGAVGLGIGYGVLTTIVLPGFVMPIWLAAVGFPAAPPLPNFALPDTILTLVGHIIYAIPVALAYAAIARE